jgi:hypothetical protein
LLTRQCIDGSWQLELPDVGAVWVREGKYIEVTLNERSSDDDIKSVLLGPALGTLCRQRNLVALRATAIATAGGAVILVGPNGVGKSATALLLLRAGFRLISDGITVLAPSANETSASALPICPMVSLWSEAVDILQIPAPTVKRVRPGLEKFSHIVDVDSFVHSPQVPVEHVVFLVSPTDTDVPSASNRVACLRRLMGHIYSDDAYTGGASARDLAAALQNVVLRGKVDVVRSNDTFDTAEKIHRLVGSAAQNFPVGVAPRSGLRMSGRSSNGSAP